MKKGHGILAAALVVVTLCGCAMQQTGDAKGAAIGAPLQQLIAGNGRFAGGWAMHPHQDGLRRAELAKGQYPIAIVVCCSDSRVPPEIVFDQGLGDIFVIRSAGEVIDDQAIGSIEYAVEQLNAQLVIVMGHDSCGAVKAVIDGGEAPGHIGSVVRAITPAVEKARQEKGDLLDNAINENILLVTNQLKASKPILSHAVESGKLTVVAARYNLATGTVHWLTKP